MPSLQTERQEQSLSGLMKKLSCHLDTLADQTHIVEHALSDQRCPTTQQHPIVITQLQSLDYLRQSLEDLAMLTLIIGKSGYGDDLPSALVTEVLQKVTLNDTKALLRLSDALVTAPHNNIGIGDLDLF